MKSFCVQSADELKAVLASFGKGYLFRGQNTDHVDNFGQSSITTSFDRQGCDPPIMLRWHHYARSILRSFVKGFDDSPDLATDQAILQHYGWRSFFVDATSSSSVACWFAGNKFEQKVRLDLIEDCWETGLVAVRNGAVYKPAEALAVVYCLSKKRLRSNNLQHVELNEITTSRGRPRFQAQHAWMVGPLRSSLPIDCITAKILAPASVFRTYAVGDNLNSTSDLFPSADDDPILASLLDMPWVHHDDGAGPNELPFYSRSLRIPEYGWPFRKIQPSSIAFYRPFWLANECPSEGPPFPNATYILTPETIFYGKPGDTSELPNLSSLLSQHEFIVAEVDGLVNHPHAGNSDHYCKGIFLERTGDLVHLGEVAICHPGMRPSDCGLVRGRHYRIGSKGLWSQESHLDDCPCGHNALHDHHLAVATHLESELARGMFDRVNSNIFAHRDVNPTLSLDHIKDRAGRAKPYFSDLEVIA